MLGSRNARGLTPDQILRCELAWEVLCGERRLPIDVTKALQNRSRTRYNESRAILILGADVYPGAGPFANSRMSPLACLAHELAHSERHEIGYVRPYEPPDSFLDEAETSIRASFNAMLSGLDREDLIEDAHDRLTDWLRIIRE